MSYMTLLEPKINVSDFDSQELEVFIEIKRLFDRASVKGVVSFGNEDALYFKKLMGGKYGLSSEQVNESLSILEEDGIISFSDRRPSFFSRLLSRRASQEGALASKIAGRYLRGLRK